MSAQFTWTGRVARNAVRQGAAAGLRGGLEIIKDASLEVVPRETDTLASTAYVDVDAEAGVGSVGYDDSRDVKTIKQHEDLSYHHPPGETAKFLERPVRAEASRALDALARSLTRSMT